MHVSIQIYDGRYTLTDHFYLTIADMHPDDQGAAIDAVEKYIKGISGVKAEPARVVRIDAKIKQLINRAKSRPRGRPVLTFRS